MWNVGQKTQIIYQRRIRYIVNEYNEKFISVQVVKLPKKTGHHTLDTDVCVRQAIGNSCKRKMTAQKLVGWSSRLFTDQAVHLTETDYACHSTFCAVSLFRTLTTGCWSILRMDLHVLSWFLDPDKATIKPARRWLKLLKSVSEIFVRGSVADARKMTFEWGERRRRTTRETVNVNDEVITSC